MIIVSITESDPISRNKKSYDRYLASVIDSRAHLDVL